MRASRLIAALAPFTDTKAIRRRIKALKTEQADLELLLDGQTKATAADVETTVKALWKARPGKAPGKTKRVSLQPAVLKVLLDASGELRPLNVRSIMEANGFKFSAKTSAERVSVISTTLRNLVAKKLATRRKISTAQSSPSYYKAVR